MMAPIPENKRSNLNLFVYGTLMFPEILHPLLDYDPIIEDAVLKGYQRHKIKSEEGERRYPAIIPDKNSTVDGKIIYNLNQESIDLLDRYEDEEYERKEITVESNGQKVRAFTYIWRKENRHLLFGEWDPKEFREKHLEDYL